MHQSTAISSATPLDNERTGLTAMAIARAVVSHLQYSVGRLPQVANLNDY